MRWMGFRWPLWDMIVFAKVKSALGGRVRWMVSGAAPLSAQVHHFLQVMKLLDHVSIGFPACLMVPCLRTSLLRIQNLPTTRGKVVNREPETSPGVHGLPCCPGLRNDRKLCSRSRAALRLYPVPTLNPKP